MPYRIQMLSHTAHTDEDRATVVHDIATGQYEDLVSVVNSNGDDVTKEIAREVMTVWADRGEPLSAWQRDFVEQLVSIEAANAFPQH